MQSSPRFKFARVRALAIRAGIGAALFYAAYFSSVWLLHRSIIFPSPKTGLEPSVPNAKLVYLDAPSGRAVALFAPASAGKATIVFFHGNGEELVDLAPLARFFVERGMGILFVEYPGYGLAAKDGPASEASIYAAAERALQFLVNGGEHGHLGVPHDRIVIVGHSLGTGVATEMAVRGYGARLVLVSPFTSMLDMVSRYTPLVPTSLLVRDRFDNLTKAPRIPIPTLIVHGDRDSLIPLEMARRVAAATPDARFEVFEGAGHNDLFHREGHRLPREIVSLLTPSRAPDGSTGDVSNRRSPFPPHAEGAKKESTLN